MGKVSKQINEQQSNELLLRSEYDREKEMFAVIRLFNKLTVKGLAMDSSAAESIVRTAMREQSPKTPLTDSLKHLFDVRRVELATAPVSLPRLQTMLNTRDSALLGTNAKHQHIHELASHLRNELNSLPLNAVLDFLKQVNAKNALGTTTEEWTLTFWKADFEAHKSHTHRNHEPLISKLLCHAKENPSFADAVRPDKFGAIELVHAVAASPWVENLGSMHTSNRALVVSRLLNGDDAGARAAVLNNRRESYAKKVLPLGNPDLTGLSLSPM